MSLKRCISICIAVAILAPGATGRAAPVARPDPDCFSCLVVAEDGTILFQRRASQPLPNASTTKIVTALVVRERAVTLEEQVRVSAQAAATPGFRLSLERGEALSVEELLSLMLLASSNQAAVALAEHVAGSGSAFIPLMNQKAADLGASDTSFANPHGLDSPGHGSSARDLATLGTALLEDPLLAEMVASQSDTITTSARTIEVDNTNELIGSYRGAIGIKTGFTASAGNVLVAAAERSGRRLVAVAMRSEDSFAAARSLLDFGFKKLARGILLAKMTPMTDIVFDPGGSVSAVATRTVRGITDPDEVVVTFEARGGLQLPLPAGARVGTAVVVDDRGVRVGTSPVVAMTHNDEGGTASWASRALGSLLSGAASLIPGERA